MVLVKIISQEGYYHRMEYPNDYKCDETRIIKFDRDYQEELEYKFMVCFLVILHLFHK